MAKPINLYQGPAPAAMGMMGQGILEAGANIGRTIQGGYESMGKSLGEGIKSAASSVAGAYTQSKQDQAKFDATKKMFKVFGGSLDENTRKEADTIFADTSMSVREKNALAPTLMQYLGAANMQSQALAKQKAELDAALARTQFSEGAATGRTAAQIASQEGQPMRNAVAGYMFPEERQPSAPTSMFGPMQVPQQTPLYSPQPQNTFAAPKKFSIHSQRPEQR
jgi:hypothetical protein